MRTVTWTRKASFQLQEIYLYIADDSPQNAEKIILNVLSKADDIVGKEEKYPFEIYRIRVSYQILEHEILIVRVRSTSQKPLKY